MLLTVDCRKSSPRGVYLFKYTLLAMARLLERGAVQDRSLLDDSFVASYSSAVEYLGASCWPGSPHLIPIIALLDRVQSRIREILELSDTRRLEIFSFGTFKRLFFLN